MWKISPWKGGCTFFPALLPPCRQGYGNMTSPPAPTLNHEVVLATGALPGGSRCWTICFQTLHKKETFCFFEPLLFSAFGDWQPILILSIRLANSKSLDAPSSVKPKPNLPSLERTAERRAWCEKSQALYENAGHRKRKAPCKHRVHCP